MSDDSTLGRLARAFRPGRSDDVLVVGLGRFGTSFGSTLVDMGHFVLGIDRDRELVQDTADRLTQTVVADATSISAMRQLGAGDFAHAVVAIGTSLEASILSTSVLVDLGVPDVWAKAMNRGHESILQRVGAHHVVQPERDMGRRVAHLLSGRVMEYLALDEGFALVETAAPKRLHGRTLADSEVRRRYDITVVALKPQGGSFTYATADTVVGPGDLLVVAGPPGKAQAFAALDS